MNLTAKDDRHQLLARKGEALPSEAMRPKPVAVALTDTTGLVLSRKDPESEAKSSAPPEPEDRSAAISAKPPSSLLDYRLVRVSTRMNDPDLPQEDMAVSASEAPGGTPKSTLDVRESGPGRSLPSRRLIGGAALLLVGFVALAILIGAMLV